MLYKCKYIVIVVFLFSTFLQAQDFELEKLPSSINTMYDEITPVVSRDGRTLFYTKVGDPGFEKRLVLGGVDISNLGGQVYNQKLASIFSELAGKQISDAVTSNYNQDIWFADLNGDGSPIKISHPDFPLNSALPNSIVSITPDNNNFVIINRFDENGYIQKGFSTVRRNGSDWMAALPLEIEGFYTLTSEVSLTMSFDGKVLILSAIRKGAQDMDLYMCRLQSNGTWSAPKHLGYTINSASRETTPYLSEDNATLFFSSNRYDTKGGNDIFMSKRLDETWENWSTPRRLSEPINSAYDDSQPYFNMTTGYIYFTSKRDGNSDIYRVKIAPPQPTQILIKGRIINGNTGEQIRTAHVDYSIEDGSKNSIFAESGVYTMQLPKGLKTELLPSKAGYTGQVSDVFFPKEYKFFQDTYIVDLVLNPLAVNALIELRPIYYKQSKAKILSKSFDELDKLVALLEERPAMHIRVEGHTDNQGRTDDLIDLSKRRADAVKAFLIKKGISEERITTIGFGAKFPINENKSDDERSKNRRVEIRITKV